MNSRACRHLLREYQILEKDPIPGISLGLQDESVFRWAILIQGPPGTLFEGGLFRVEMRFPDNYPDYPPVVTFVSDIFHPNIYSDGTVCISILHAPGNDPNNYEKASERWLPVHSVSSILISIISLLNDPNIESPANVDAAKLYRDDFVAYKKRVRLSVRRSLDD